MPIPINEQLYFHLFFQQSSFFTNHLRVLPILQFISIKKSVVLEIATEKVKIEPFIITTSWFSAQSWDSRGKARQPRPCRSVATKRFGARPQESEQRSTKSFSGIIIIFTTVFQWPRSGVSGFYAILDRIRIEPIMQSHERKRWKTRWRVFQDFQVYLFDNRFLSFL